MRVSQRARFLLVVVACATAALAAMFSAAEATDKELLDTLLENGAITESQYQRLLSPDDEAEPAGVKKPTVADQPPVAATEPEKVEPAAPRNRVNVVLDRSGFEVQTTDGNFTLGIGGRLHVQASGHINDEDLPDDDEATDGTEIRRGRITIGGTLYHDWIYAAEVDFADNRTSVKDFWMGYAGLPMTEVFLGNQKQPYSLSVEESSNDIPFIERSVDNELVIPFVDRAIGLRANVAGDHWFLASGVFGEGIDPNRDDDEGWGAAGRFIWAPIINESMVLHLGVRSAYRQPSTSDYTVRMSDETTNMSNLSVVDTGDIDDVRDVVLVGPEAAFAFGPVSIFGEYNQGFFNRRTSRDLDFDSWYIAGTWSITGESRARAYRINAGEFKHLPVDNNFSLSEGGWGAWELATRLSSIDLNDGPVTGGEELVVTTGLNWYINPDLRFMFDWSRIVDTDGSNAVRIAAEGMDILQFRGEVVF